MATIVDRRGPGRAARGTAHHARDRSWSRPPQHTRDTDAPHAVRHAAGHRGQVWRDLGLAVLTLAVAAAVVLGLLHLDPETRAALIELLQGWQTVARGWWADLPWP
ncbi:hypothetical protein [Cellulomonas sp. S1-8]|uniref:hypothetical protein n=1 Tax=Cellulomonas sp. S1-8 TaxID=2904790 RepID=UPI002243A7F3|nr:hypothetical protein [Cellulomonas sp. S1-8]UZN02953.1 hypothetical protein OKX07_18165 [Cellulomonas sp. S1-8]